MGFVDDMVGARWRLRRIAIMQTAAFDLQMDKDETEIHKHFSTIDQPTRLYVAFSNLANNERSLELLMRYETNYSRMHDRAFNSLQKLQNERLDAAESDAGEDLRNEPKTPEPAPATEPPSDGGWAEFDALTAKLSPEMLLRVAETLNLKLPGLGEVPDEGK